MKVRKQKDWTSRGGTSNSSRQYLAAVRAVEHILRHHAIGDSPYMTARNIVSALAHGDLRLAPSSRTPQEEP